MATKKVTPEPVVEKQLIKLDVASGQRKQPGYVGIDIANLPEVDIVHNLSHFPWPIESESVTDIHCSHYIEHIPMAYWNPGNNYTITMETADSVDTLCKYFEELHRIMTPGGKAYIIAPYYNHMRCWQDPTHRRAICDASLYYVSKEWRKANGLDHYGMPTCDFEAVWGYGYDQSVMARNDEYKAFAAKHYTNSVADIHITLTKKQL